MKQWPRIDPQSAVPLWRQLEDGVRQLVGAGHWATGEPVPSVRALASELLINPATVSKAYQRLVDGGILVVRRGDGTFVAPSLPVPNRLERRRALRDAAERYAGAAAALGADAGETISVLEGVLGVGVRATSGGKR